MADDDTPDTDEDVAFTTRERLVHAAVAIADEHGLGAVTTVNVTRRAGIAQSSYYTHFKSIDELLEEIGLIGAEHSRRSTSSARILIHDEAGDVERQRDHYRAPLRAIREHPDLFRLQLRTRTEPTTSALGRSSRATVDANRLALAADLLATGRPRDPDGYQLRYEMLADCVIAMIEQLGLGGIEGRYQDDEELVDLLMLLTQASPTLGRWLDWHGPPRTTDPPPARPRPRAS